MTVGTYDTAVLIGVVESLEESAFHILDLYFPRVQTEQSEEIHFDNEEDDLRLAPFVSPLKSGKVMVEEGFNTKSFKPAYVKDKTVFKPEQALKRSIGEAIAGNLSGSQRMDRALRQALSRKRDRLTRREEWMAAQAMIGGQVTVEGDGYPTVVVDFGRDAALTASLVGTDQWSDTANSDPLKDFEDFAALTQEKSGAPATNITMDTKAWKLFANHPKVQPYLDYRRGTTNTINIDPIALGQGKQKARYKGSIGDFDIWVYQDRYTDDNGTSQNMMPDNTIIAGSPFLAGTRAYGMILDEEADYSTERYFVKSWLEKDPAVRYLLGQSAPLVVPYRPNASYRLQVA